MSICGRRVENPQQVIDRLRYETVGASLALASSVDDTVLSAEDQEKFKLHLRRYLLGKGHPMHKDWGLDHVDQESRDLVAQDQVMRSKRLLTLTTGSELLPSNYRQRISVCLPVPIHIFFYH